MSAMQSPLLRFWVNINENIWNIHSSGILPSEVDNIEGESLCFEKPTKVADLLNLTL